MLNRILIALIISSILVSSCAYDVTKNDYENEYKYFERITNLCRNEKKVTLTTTDLERIACKEILLTKNLTSFIRAESDTLETLSTNEIYSISFPNKTSGFEGFLIGGLGGIIYAIASKSETTIYIAK